MEKNHRNHWIFCEFVRKGEKSKEKGHEQEQSWETQPYDHFEKERVGLCTEHLTMEDYHRNGPITDNQKNLTLPIIIWKAWMLNIVLDMALIRSWSEQYFLSWSPHFKKYTFFIMNF